MKRAHSIIERGSFALTRWVGTPTSIFIHSLFFVAMFGLPALGVMPFEEMLLVLTTIVSLEAIYLALFIQMTVNRTSEDLEEVEEDLKDVGEDLRDLSEDIDEIQEDDDQDESRHLHVQQTLSTIEHQLRELQLQIQELRKST